MDTITQPPCFDILNDKGQRLRVQPRDHHDTVLVLATAAQIHGTVSTKNPAPRTIVIDDREVSTTVRLHESGIKHGSRIGPPEPPIKNPAPVEQLTCTGLEAAWVAGPDAGHAVALRQGNNVIGRSTHAAVRCQDSTIELHHAVVAVEGS